MKEQTEIRFRTRKNAKGGTSNATHTSNKKLVDTETSTRAFRPVEEIPYKPTKVEKPVVAPVRASSRLASNKDLKQSVLILKKDDELERSTPKRKSTPTSKESTVKKQKVVHSLAAMTDDAVKPTCKKAKVEEQSIVKKTAKKVEITKGVQHKVLAKRVEPTIQQKVTAKHAEPTIQEKVTTKCTKPTTTKEKDVVVLDKAVEELLDTSKKVLRKAKEIVTEEATTERAVVDTPKEAVEDKAEKAIEASKKVVEDKAEKIIDTPKEAQVEPNDNTKQITNSTEEADEETNVYTPINDLSQVADSPSPPSFLTEPATPPPPTRHYSALPSAPFKTYLSSADKERIEREVTTLSKLRKALDIVITDRHARNRPSLYHQIEPVLRISTGRTITISHICKIMYITPKLYTLEVKELRNFGGKVTEVFLIEFGKEWEIPLAGKDLQMRADILDNALKTYFNTHKEPDATVPQIELPRLSKVVDKKEWIKEAKLPPGVKSLLEAHEKAKAAAVEAQKPKPKPTGSVKDRMAALRARLAEKKGSSS